MRLLDGNSPLITVTYGDSQEWTALGESVDALACGREWELIGDLCDSDGETDMDVSLTGYEAPPFAVVARQKFGTRCAPEEAEKLIQDAMTAAAEHQIGQALWEGVTGTWDGVLYLTSSEVASTTITGDVKADIAAVVKAARDANPDLNPLLHLGLEAALVVGVDLDRIDIPYVVNSGYPVDGIAITDEVTIRLGSVQVLRTIAYPNNKMFVEATRLAAVSFDPCLARRGSATS